ncbi:hypothetical protein [Persicobacter diffluens]|uniref:Lipoprotein n=1 Tax=Persicobacter diffluens TaxID=981 RepID=A0AAN4VVT3_9BACT|nr:hypothetical protein PEDI_05230 [Persicobacter diffluens]
MNKILKSLAFVAVAGLALSACTDPEESFDVSVPSESFHVAGNYAFTELDPIKLSVPLEGNPSKVTFMANGEEMEMVVADGLATYTGTYGDFGLANESGKNKLSIDFRCYQPDGYIVKHSGFSLVDANSIEIDALVYNEETYEAFVSMARLYLLLRRLI